MVIRRIISRRHVLVACLIIFLFDHAVAPVLAFSDPVGDLFDRNGNPISAESYLDIVTYDLSLSGGTYTGKITVNGPIPSSISSDTLVEWDFLIDADRNNATSPWRLAIITNTIGVDYLVRVTLLGGVHSGQVLGFVPRTTGNLTYKIDNQTVTIEFTSSDIGGSKDFDFVAVVRKYVPYDAPGTQFSAADKAPNLQYITVPEFSVGLLPVVLSTSLFISLCFARRRMTKNRAT